MTEAEIQKELVKYFRTKYPKYNNCVRLSLNGINLGRSGARVMASAKAQGLTIGESDLCFLVPSNGCHGLLIELKTETGVSTQAQNEYIDLMNTLGYRAVICYGLDHAIETLDGYLEQDFGPYTSPVEDERPGSRD